MRVVDLPLSLLNEDYPSCYIESENKLNFLKRVYLFLGSNSLVAGAHLGHLGMVVVGGIFPSLVNFKGFFSSEVSYN